MTIDGLKQKLCAFGFPLIVKEGVVFTVLIKGKNLSQYKNVEAIQNLILGYAGEKYPLIEAMVNEDEFFCLVLKPQVKNH